MPSLNNAETTIIVATYNWPQVLVQALKGISLQTYTRWRVLVIGDCCSPDSAEQLQQITDPRFRYINLSQRFGEQSGPNSIGMALADTPYIAFLNQDDVWLPDHLERAVNQLQANNADFFTSRAAFAITEPNDSDRYIFLESSPVGRKLPNAFAFPFFYFEPVSSWVITKNAVNKVGLWKPAAEIYRTPLENWVLRAYKKRINHTDSDTITVLKNNAKENRTAGNPIYSRTSPVMSQWIESIAFDGGKTIRKKIVTDLRTSTKRPDARDFSKPKGPGEFSREADRRLNPLALALFKLTGWDSMKTVCRASGLERGWRLRNLSLYRTGEQLPEPPDFRSVLKDAENQLKLLQHRT